MEGLVHFLLHALTSTALRAAGARLRKGTFVRKSLAEGNSSQKSDHHQTCAAVLSSEEPLSTVQRSRRCTLQLGPGGGPVYSVTTA